MNISKKIFKILLQIATTLLFALLLIAVYGKIQMIVLKQNYSTFFGYTMFQVASNSMAPTLKVDDVILVKVTDSLNTNDIISYEDNGSIITHRIISVAGEKITVKGDANNAIDIPIEKDVVIGKVVKVFPELKVWQNILSDPKILFFLFLTLLSFDFAFSYKKKNKSKENKASKDSKKAPTNDKPRIIATMVEPVKEIEKQEETHKTEEKVIEEESQQPTEEIIKEENQPIKEEAIEEEIINEKSIKKGSKDIIEASELLELTQRIDLEELSKLMENKSITKEDYDTLNLVYDEVNNIETQNINQEEREKLEEKLSEYTIRLDLKAIQQQISKKIK